MERENVQAAAVVRARRAVVVRATVTAGDEQRSTRRTAARASASATRLGARARVSEQDCKAASANRPSNEGTTLALAGNAIMASTRASCELQRTYDASRKPLQSKPEAVKRLDQAQLTWQEYASAAQEERFPAEDPRATYGSVYPVCSSMLDEALTRQRTKELPASTSCKSSAKASPKALSTLAEAQAAQRAVLERIKRLYAADRRFVRALKAAQAAYLKLENAQVALAGEIAGGPDGDCAQRAQLRSTNERRARLQEWLTIEGDSCAGSQGSALDFSASKQAFLAKDGTKRALAARDLVKRLRPEVERLTKALKAAETKLEVLGKDRNTRSDAASVSARTYPDSRRSAASFPVKEQTLATSALQAALTQDSAYGKQLQLVRKTRADLAKALPPYSAARTEAGKATAAVVSAAKQLEGWTNAPSAEAATKALAVVEQENAKLVAIGAPENVEVMNRTSSESEARWTKDYPSRSTELGGQLARLKYDRKLNDDPKAKKHCDLNEVDWKNFTLPPNWLVDDMKLENGHAESMHEDAMGDLHGAVADLTEVHIADLDRDGKPEAHLLVTIGGVGHAAPSSMFIHVFDTDPNCTIRLVTRAEICDYQPKFTGKTWRWANCDDVQEDYTLADGDFKKVRAKKK